ncbi:hypothetical protein ABL78_2395 [Leptomonas seymouri]|uniref:TMEM164 family protein n=1 Tax=Leptomonas seymouri TaxID=5684 RepID=A0A0N0P785_LEPSE|nr:hypothetical protein ABL78_2395 [Leptomonas seymouri]|eukprot:KPI88499.1 hypothetical protein ABL78_2395 [Leptomonas seymouri]
MESALIDFCEAVVPDSFADALQTFAAHTGLKWGVMPSSHYWFQPPKVHVGLFALAMVFCVALRSLSRGFRSSAIAQLLSRGAGRSLRCSANTFIACLLMICLGAQVYTKGSRPKPLVQLAWLLMPCHIFTGLWVWILLHGSPQSYGRNCYLATLMVDWLWGPVAAALRPDWGDHRFLWESYIFATHHGLLLLLPFYYAVRYDTLGLSWPHIFHMTWVPTLINFALFCPYGLFVGLNVNYQLAPPPLGRKAPAVLRSVMFRPAFVITCVVLSVISNVMTRWVAKMIRAMLSAAQHTKPKAM